MIVSKKLALRRFNDAGLKKFEELLQNRTKNLFKDLEKLTSDSSFSDPLNVDLDWKSVTNRLDLAQVMW